MIGTFLYAILLSVISTTAVGAISFEPYEHFRHTCQSSTDCHQDEKCVRILVNNTSRTGCFRTRSIHEPCSLNVECSLKNRLSACEHGSCKCKAFMEYDEVTNDCYSASTCKYDTDCAPGKRCFANFCNDPKQFCLSQSTCQPYEYCSNTRCHIPKQVGELCTAHHECKRRDVHSYCHSDENRQSFTGKPRDRKSSVCSCKSKYSEDSSTRKCVPMKPDRMNCADHGNCPEGFNCKDGLCSREAGDPDKRVIEKVPATSTHPEKEPIFHRASNETRYYVLIAGCLFMVISMIAGVAGCIRRSREITQSSQRRSQATVGMRTGRHNTDSSDSRLTPRSRRVHRTQFIDRSGAARVIDDDPPPPYETIVQPPPSFDDIIGSSERKLQVA